MRKDMNTCRSENNIQFLPIKSSLWPYLEIHIGVGVSAMEIEHVDETKHEAGNEYYGQLVVGDTAKNRTPITAGK
jgi:hypothetical protein